MVYEISVESSFVAQHGIRLPNGTVEPTHKHVWQVTVRFIGDQLDACGLLVDFDDVKAALAQVLGPVQGADLNQSALLNGLNPTAENVALTLFDALYERCGRDKRLSGVEVTEAPGCTATYRRPRSP